MTRREAKSLASHCRRFVRQWGWRVVEEVVSKTSTSRYMLIRKDDVEHTIRISDHDQWMSKREYIEIRSFKQVAQLSEKLSS